MRKQPTEAAKWDWLADPTSTLELYEIERRAFYNWKAVEREWSGATSQTETSDPGRLTKEQLESIESLKRRLDDAAQEYEKARQELHKAWSA